jgi:hypothetical protein
MDFESYKVYPHGGPGDPSSARILMRTSKSFGWFKALSKGKETEGSHVLILDVKEQQAVVMAEEAKKGGRDSWKGLVDEDSPGEFKISTRAYIAQVVAGKQFRLEPIDEGIVQECPVPPKRVRKFVLDHADVAN